jgi:hypothetical protein
MPALERVCAILEIAGRLADFLVDRRQWGGRGRRLDRRLIGAAGLGRARLPLFG